MRGLRRKARQDADRDGITPAHAGLTLQQIKQLQAEWDHPRACGAYPFRFAAFAFGLGSPPRMRGLHFLTAYVYAMFGITPAHAGLTANTQNTDKTDSGSPPRMRGLPTITINRKQDAGITPAHAGLTDIVCRRDFAA